MADVGNLEQGTTLDLDEIDILSALDVGERGVVECDSKKYLVTSGKHGDFFQLSFTEAEGDNLNRSFLCNTRTGELSRFNGCNASDVRAFINGARVLTD